ncbi:MAG: DUF5106 domain-containing protein [Muribaculaceae bacterium]
MRKLFTTYLITILCSLSVKAQYCSMGYVDRIKGAHSREAVLSQARQAEQFLYTAGSEGYDEDIYIEVLNALLNSPLLTDADKVRPQMQLTNALKNRPGQQAADIAFITPDDASHSLSEYDTPFCILLFNDPDCDECAQLKHAITQNQLLCSMVEQNKLSIIGIYPYDDRQTWLSTPMPGIIVNGWDSQAVIDEQETYYLPKIPTLYLLGANMTVLLKDTTLQQIVQYLSKNSQ